MKGSDDVRRLVVGQAFFREFGQVEPSLEAREVIEDFRKNVVELPHVGDENGSTLAIQRASPMTKVQQGYCAKEYQSRGGDDRKDMS